MRGVLYRKCFVLVKSAVQAPFLILFFFVYRGLETRKPSDTISGGFLLPHQLFGPEQYVCKRKMRPKNIFGRILFNLLNLFTSLRDGHKFDGGVTTHSIVF